MTFLLTKPTGTSNRAFTSSISSQKTIERILPETWENKKTETVHGFFVRNTKRENIRIMTDDGCYSCKGNDSCWVWSNEIVRVFSCEKSMDWPKWSLYPKNPPQWLVPIIPIYIYLYHIDVYFILKRVGGFIEICYKKCIWWLVKELDQAVSKKTIKLVSIKCYGIWEHLRKLIIRNGYLRHVMT